MATESETAIESPTGAVLLDRWSARQQHAHVEHCPRCGDDLMRVGITYLAYRFDACRCDRYAYPHIVEQLWHNACLTEEAPALAERQLLTDAERTLRGYKRAQWLADEIAKALAR